mmetsp:Transcript_10011/g.19560  ORF Transcript_10011/g.19560 Transcript_10011/m.19560 type:complete len:275 (-) Transcript_10011:1231-2055(-)
MRAETPPMRSNSRRTEHEQGPSHWQTASIALTRASAIWRMCCSGQCANMCTSTCGPASCSLASRALLCGIAGAGSARSGEAGTLLSACDSASCDSSVILDDSSSTSSRVLCDDDPSWSLSTASASAATCSASAATAGTSWAAVSALCPSALALNSASSTREQVPSAAACLLSPPTRRGDCCSLLPLPFCTGNICTPSPAAADEPPEEIDMTGSDTDGKAAGTRCTLPDADDEDQTAPLASVASLSALGCRGAAGAGVAWGGVEGRSSEAWSRES